jgi:hypothetical protein
MADFLAFGEGNVSYIPETKDEKDDIQLSDDWPRAISFFFLTRGKVS